MGSEVEYIDGKKMERSQGLNDEYVGILKVIKEEFCSDCSISSMQFTRPVKYQSIDCNQHLAIEEQIVSPFNIHQKYFIIVDIMCSAFDTNKKKDNTNLLALLYSFFYWYFRSAFVSNYVNGHILYIIQSGVGERPEVYNFCK